MLYTSDEALLLKIAFAFEAEKHNKSLIGIPVE